MFTLFTLFQSFLQNVTVLSLFYCNSSLCIFSSLYLRILIVYCSQVDLSAVVWYVADTYTTIYYYCESMTSSLIRVLFH